MNTQYFYENQNSFRTNFRTRITTTITSTTQPTAIPAIIPEERDVRAGDGDAGVYGYTAFWTACVGVATNDPCALL
jgi:hypothetical protein